MQDQKTNQLLQALPDELVPKKMIDSEQGPNERTLLLVPRFRKGFSKKYVQPRLKKPYIKVELDDIGSFVWNKIDGMNTISSYNIILRAIMKMPQNIMSRQ